MDKQTWYIHTMEYYLIIKWDEVMIYTICTNLENIMVSEKS